MRKLLLLMSLILFTGFCSAQLSVNLQQPPPNQLRATDIWKITIINSGKSTLQVTINGTLELSGEGIIIEGNSNIISLPSGIKRITYDDIKTGSVTFKSGKWREAFTRTGNAPSGDYTICVHVKDQSGEEIGTSCTDQNVAITSAPALNSPADGGTIQAQQPPVFTWMPPRPMPSGQVIYKLKIVEILGNQSPNIAIQRNPALFEKSDIRSTMFQYPVSARQIELGKQYAWTVQAFNSSGQAIGENNGTAQQFTFSTVAPPHQLRSMAAPNPDTTASGSSNSTSATSGNGSAAIGDTIRAGLNGEFKAIVAQITTEADSSLTGKATVYMHWLMTSVAVEFKKIRIDSTKRLISGGIVTSESGSSNTSYQAYPKAWALSLLSGPGVANVVDNTINWTNNQINNLVTWTNGLNFGQPSINYNSNIPPPPIPNNALKMPFGLQFNNGNQKLVITEIIFEKDESKINFLAQEQFTKSATVYKLGFAGKYFKIHPNSIDFSSGRVELAEDISIPNTSANPKMTLNFEQGTDSSGCYVEWDSAGITEVNVGIDVTFSRDWLLPVPTSNDTVTATFTGNGTSLQDILLTGVIPHCEIVGTNGLKIEADTISLDLSDTRNPDGMYFPKNYTNDTSSAAKLQWEGLYIKSFGLTLPDTWKTGANPTQVIATDLIIDDFGVTMKMLATNVVTFSTGKVANLSASLDTLRISMLKGSLTDGSAKGLIVLPISKDTVTNSLRYTATFSQAANVNTFQIVIVPIEPINADILKGKMTLDPTSNITALISPNLKQLSVSLNGSFKWDNPNLVPPAASSAFRALGIQGIKMEMDFENIGLVYKHTTSSDSLTFSPGTWSFASPQKFLANFPVSIKKVYYKSLSTVAPSNSNSKELFRGALMIDIVADLTEDIGGSTTVGAAFAVELNTSTIKFKPEFKGVFIDSIAVHANLPAVNIEGSICFRDNDPVYGNGYLGTLSVAFTPVGISANALVEFGNTNYQNGSTLYRYWRVEADVLLPPPGIPFLPGIAFRGFGGGAYYNMDATLTTSTQTPSGKKYTFKPKYSTFGLKVAAVIATTPKEETFNADVSLDAQFSKAQGLIFIAFNGDFYVGAGLTTLKRAKAEVKGNVNVSYNFPDKHFNLSASVLVDAPPIKTPNPANLVLDINGKLNQWYFKFGEPTSNPSSLVSVDVFNVHLYQYLMFGNHITPPTGFTQTFKDGYHGVFGTYPGMAVSTAGVTNLNTATGKGLALGVGFAFNKNLNFNVIGSYDASLALGAGAELDLAFAEYNGMNCENPAERIGINGWQASGDIGFYAYVVASIKNTSNGNTWQLADIRAGGWLTGKFPNPVYVAGAVQGLVKIGHFTTWTHALGDWYYHSIHDYGWGPCVHLQDHYLVNTSFNHSFTYGTNCGTSTALTGTAVTQGDAAGDQQQLLIKYVHPSQQYDFPIQSPLAVQYGLIPNNVFDVSEQQSDGSVKSRTFKMVVTTNLKVQNTDGSFSIQNLRSNENNLGEFLYTVIVPNVINTSTQMAVSGSIANTAILSNSSTHLNTNLSANINHSYALGNMQTITYPLPPVTSSYGNLPPEPPEIHNDLTINKNYVFTVTATLKEYVNNVWVDAKNKTNHVVTQTITKNLRTGSQYVTVSTQQLQQQVH
jgi:hypothetical protein